MDMEVIQFLVIAIFLASTEAIHLRDTMYFDGTELTFYNKEKFVYTNFYAHVCQAMKPGSALVKIKSKNKQIAVEQLIDPNGNMTEAVMIGGRDKREYQVESRIFLWDDGEYVDTRYSNWAIGQPPVRAEYIYDRGRHRIHLKKFDNQWKWIALSWFADVEYVCETKTKDLHPSSFANLTYSDTLTNGSKTVMTYSDAEKECERNQSKIVDVTNEEMFYTIRRKAESNVTLRYWVKNKGSSEDCFVMGAKGWSINKCDDPTVHYVCERTRAWNLTVSEEFPVVLKSKRFVVRCAASGYPVPSVSWYRNGKRIRQNKNKRFYQVLLEGKARLVFKKVQPWDKGFYHCYANNTDQRIRGFSKLTVVRNDEDLKQQQTTTPNQFFMGFVETFGGNQEKSHAVQEELKQGEFSASVSKAPEQEILPEKEESMCSTWKFLIFAVMAILWIIVVASYTMHKCFTRLAQTKKIVVEQNIKGLSTIPVY